MERASAALSPSELVLARYRPLRPLGSGSSGSVWLARDERTGLDVALKVVAQQGKAGARAEREAGAAAQLRHKRCQRVYEHGSDGGHVYIAYEYVPGVTLREATRAGKLTDAEAVEAGAQVLEALGHAHGRGIVHRDVKPANVLVADSAEVSIRLLDFGLARFAQADTLTAVGDVPGTLAYISPERLRGEAASPASDVWSVGVMLWEALAGRHPFWATSLVKTSEKIEAGAPPLAKARPDLPRALVAEVERALDHDPVRRPPAAELAKRLRLAARAKDGRPSRTVPSLPQVELPTAGRIVPAVLAALFAGWSSATLAFFPGGWPVFLALLAAVLTFWRPRAGLAFALAVPVFPLGNLSLGLAVLYGVFALFWFLLHLREPRAGLAFVLGPLLAPVGALGLLPLLVQPLRSVWRRALHAGTGVVVAGIVAGLDHRALPFGSGRITHLGIDEARSPLAVASSLWHALTSHPAFAAEALALAAAAALIPLARRHGLWAIAVFGAALIGATVLLAPHADPLPAVATAWITCIALAAWDRRRAWLWRLRPRHALAPEAETRVA